MSSETKKVWKVRYVGGSGISLAYPLKCGITDFRKGQVVELEFHTDFVRCVTSKGFEPVYDEVQEAVQEPMTAEVPALQENAVTVLAKEEENASAEAPVDRKAKPLSRIHRTIQDDQVQDD